MKAFVRRFARHWFRAAISRSWAARDSFGVRCFVLIWLVVLCLPFLRTVFETQTSRSSLSYFRASLPSYLPSSGKIPAAFSIGRLHAQFPNDRDLQIAYAEGESLLFDEERESDYTLDPAYFGYKKRPSEVDDVAVYRYGDLMTRNPNDAVSVARWLCKTANRFRDVRVAGILEATPTPQPTPVVFGPPRSFPPGPGGAPSGPPMTRPFQSGSYTSVAPIAQFCQATARGGPPPSISLPSPTPQPTPNFTAAQLNRAIEVARRGQKLEPNNSYFDWNLIYFLLCANRDEEALRVLDAASHQPIYDDHSCDLLAAFIRARERVRPTLIEEKWADVYNDSGYGTFDKATHVINLLSWLAWQKQQNGDVQGAISIRAALARLINAMSDARATHLNNSQQRLKAIWRYDLRPLFSYSSTSRPRIRPSLHAAANNFGTFALANNRPEIARETQNIVQKAANRDLLYRRYDGFMLSRIFFYTLFTKGCLWSIGVSLALYVALSILLLLSKPVQVERRDVWKVTPLLAFAALIGIFCLNFALSHLQAGGYEPWDLSGEMPQTLWLLGTGMVLLFGAPISLNGLWCALSAWWRERKAPEVKAVATGLKILRYALFFVVGSTWFYAISYSIVAFVMLWQGVTSWNVTLPALGEVDFRQPWQNLLFIWPIVAAFSLVSWFFYARIFAAPPRTHSLYALRRFRQTLLALVPVYSALWVLVALLSIPQRRLAETQLDDLLRHGEVYVAQNMSKYR